MPTTIITNGKKCKPFTLKVMVFSPESGFKFEIEVQKACSANNDPIWKLIFDLFKKIDGNFVEVVSVEFVAGDPNDIDKIAAITSDGMKKAQVQAFRDEVYPLVKPFADSNQKPTPDQQKAVQAKMDKAINAQ
jgi:hypothetical protein